MPIHMVLLRRAKSQPSCLTQYLKRESAVQPLSGPMVRLLIPAWPAAAAKALFMTVWCPDSRSVESNCGIPRG